MQIGAVLAFKILHAVLVTVSKTNTVEYPTILYEVNYK